MSVVQYRDTIALLPGAFVCLRICLWLRRVMHEFIQPLALTCKAIHMEHT